ncbi:hypothetical protein V496_08593 [Pseudogymnoascus sp. VKM F-4515 (FW-2607)]|nr:hypothetical protein V496_08593 [Pseudogymnoascus sp. VKM F-4515 (FW-2607)]
MGPNAAASNPSSGPAPCHCQQRLLPEAPARDPAQDSHRSIWLLYDAHASQLRFPQIVPRSPPTGRPQTSPCQYQNGATGAATATADKVWHPKKEDVAVVQLHMPSRPPIRSLAMEALRGPKTIR